MSGGRRRPRPEDCDHVGPLQSVAVEGGYRLRCLVCGKLGPVREDSAAARQALRESAGGP